MQADYCGSAETWLVFGSIAPNAIAALPFEAGVGPVGFALRAASIKNYPGCPMLRQEQ